MQDRNVWVFDLDNTLYPAECDLFAQIDVRMTDFVSRFLNLKPADARKVQKDYYRDYGTTLNGLIHNHAVEPQSFLDYVHDIDLSPLPDGKALARELAALPGRKFIYTNGSRSHSARVTAHMGLADLFDGHFAIEDSQMQPKPCPAAFQAFCDTHAIDPKAAVFFEDLERNLAPAKALGFTTVWVKSNKDWSHEPEGLRPGQSARSMMPAHVDYETDNLTEFLKLNTLKKGIDQ